MERVAALNQANVAAQNCLTLPEGRTHPRRPEPGTVMKTRYFTLALTLMLCWAGLQRPYPFQKPF